MWFRATDIPTTKPRHLKYNPSRPPTKFQPFAWTDSQRIEKAFQRGESSVVVETDGLLEVLIPQRLCKPTYWDGFGYKVRRGTWFELQSQSKLFPLPEEEATILEGAWTASLKKVALSQGVEAAFAFDSKQPTAIVTEHNWIAAIRRFEVPKQRKLVRGYRLKDVRKDSGTKKAESSRPAYVPRPIKHLILCIHGIGQLINVKFEFVNFVKDVDALRGALTNSLQGEAFKNALNSFDGNTQVQTLPICWRHELPHHVSHEQLDMNLRDLRPQSLFGRENLLADVVLDFVMYMQPHYRDAILRTVANLMNTTVRRFTVLNDGIEPRIHVLGHSLGSVIANDLLRERSLFRYKVDNLFLTGSPIGVLQLLQGQPFTKYGLNASNVYNIMRLSDPVAARLEPLVTRDSVDDLPQPLPGGSPNVLSHIRDLTDELTSRGAILTSGAQQFWDTLTRLVIHRPSDSEDTDQPVGTMGETTTAYTSSTKCPPPHEHKRVIALEEFNRHGRLDFSVSEGVDISWLLGVAGHLMYLDNADVAAFILREIHRV